MKRKVQYQVWIPAKKIDPKPNVHGYVIGTNCFSEPSTGYFHQWGIETEDRAEDTLSNTIAIVEDCITGYVHKVDPTKMRFMLPPDPRMELPVPKASSRLSQSFDMNEVAAAILDQIQIISNKLNLL